MTNLPLTDEVHCILAKWEKEIIAGKASFVGDIALHDNAFNKLNSSNRLSVIPAT